MKIKKLSAAVLLVSVFMLNSAYAGSNYSYQQAQPQQPQNYGYQSMPYSSNTPLKGSVVTVPAGANFPATLTAELSSETAATGQAVSLVLNKDFYYNNKLIAPSGSMVNGTVVEVTHAKHGSINGKICVRFTQIVTPMGSQIPISGIIKTDDNSGVLTAGTKVDVAKEYTKDLAVGSAAGALSGLVFGALAGGSVGRGAALGTAVGAGGGLVKSVIDKGSNVVIPANSSIEIVLTQPITAAASNYSYEN